MNLDTRWRLGLWQFAFLCASLSWFLAPSLNHVLSYRTGLISQYELPGQPYAWIFRLGDLMGALLLVGVAFHYQKKSSKKIGSLLLLIVAIGMMADPLLSTTCHFQNGQCIEYISVPFLLHALETVITSAGIFILACYDARLRRRLVSISFVIFQILYGLLFVSQLATQDRFNTFSQFIYEMGTIVWLAWYVRDYVVTTGVETTMKRSKLIKNIIALWSFINGVFAIIISLADIRVVGKLKGLYFAGDSAWLAQHSMIIGVVLIYLSRHLSRGERRARHIFMLVAGLEALKYAVITPHLGLLTLYFLTFCLLFILRQPFDRGRRELTWILKFKEITFLTVSLLFTAALALTLLYSNSHDSDIANKTWDHFLDYTIRSPFTPDSRLESALLAHAISAFILSAAILIMWILFRPARLENSYTESSEAKRLLNLYSTSTEDYFKVWPCDKHYFYANNGFIAYKVVGPVAYALADPIASSKNDQTELLSKYLAYCRENGWKIAFLPIYKQGKFLYEGVGLNMLQIGSSAVIDIDHFLTATVKDKWWRWKNNRATKSGLSYHVSHGPHSSNLMDALSRVSDEWLTKAGRQERGFALGYFDPQYMNQCTIHYLMDSHNHLVAFANQLPQFKTHKTATLDLIRHLPQHSDAMPYLLYQTMVQMNIQNIKNFDLGFVPFAATEKTLIKLIKSLSSGRFSARGLEQFKNKFDPKWEPNYLAYDGDLADLAIITLNLETAMAKEDD